MGALKEVKAYSDVLPGSGAERAKLKKPSEDGRPKSARRSSARRGGSGRRTRSEPRRLDKLRRSFDEQARDANQAQGLLCRARAQLQDGDASQARKLTSEARQLAEQHIGGSTVTGALVPGAPIGYSAASMDLKRMTGAGANVSVAGPASPKRAELKAQILALAREDPPQTGAGPLPHQRPWRDCELQELSRSSAVARREVHGACEDVREMEAELRRRQRSQDREDDMLLRAAEAQFGATLQRSSSGSNPFQLTAPLRSPRSQAMPTPSGAASTPAAPVPLIPPVPLVSVLQGGGGRGTGGYPGSMTPMMRSVEQPQMCVAFLESGRCEKGDQCQFAHHPSELAVGRASRQSLDEVIRRGGYPSSLPAPAGGYPSSLPAPAGGYP